ncbi:MAG TPA: SHOCT domain-containing protein [Chromatiaceae bacterium]|nr:SHOCT domain-containing protein [Chromatiaceae bacterium]
MYEGHWFGGGFMWLFWIALIIVLLWVVKIASRSESSSLESSKSALDILKERYVRGEINQEEYEQKKKDIAG